MKNRLNIRTAVASVLGFLIVAAFLIYLLPRDGSTPNEMIKNGDNARPVKSVLPWRDYLPILKNLQEVTLPLEWGCHAPFEPVAVPKDISVDYTQLYGRLWSKDTFFTVILGPADNEFDPYSRPLLCTVQSDGTPIDIFDGAGYCSYGVSSVLRIGADYSITVIDTMRHFKADSSLSPFRGIDTTIVRITHITRDERGRFIYID
jgi:hypothetical protein